MAKIDVAPLAGAWIEIKDAAEMLDLYESLPSRERGLKFRFGMKTSNLFWSLPSRERGLKCLYQH